MAVVTEGIQILAPGRAGLLSDVILDTLGAVASIGALTAITEISDGRRHRRRNSSMVVFTALCIMTIAYLLCNDGTFYTQICFYVYLAVGALSSVIFAVINLRR